MRLGTMLTGLGPKLDQTCEAFRVVLMPVQPVLRLRHLTTLNLGTAASGPSQALTSLMAASRSDFVRASNASRSVFCLWQAGNWLGSKPTSQLALGPACPRPLGASPSLVRAPQRGQRPPARRDGTALGTRVGKLVLQLLALEGPPCPKPISLLPPPECLHIREDYPSVSKCQLVTTPRLDCAFSFELAFGPGLH